MGKILRKTIRKTIRKIISKTSRISFDSLNNEKQSEVLLIDENYSNIQDKNLPFKCSSLDLRKFYVKCIPLNIFIYIIDREAFKTLYLGKIFSKFDAKIIIAHHLSAPSIINDDLFHNKIFLVYQIFGVSQSIIESYKKRKCDYFLSFNAHQSKLFKEKIIGKILVSGSISSNFKSAKEVKKTRSNVYKKIIYISEYRGLDRPDQDFLVKNLNLSCNSLGYKLDVALMSSRRDKKKKLSPQLELGYFRSLDVDLPYEKIDSWVKASNADLIISIQSNLGYELFSHKKKVLFVCENKPYFLGEKSDLLWLPKPDLELLKSRIFELVELNNKSWQIHLENNYTEYLTGDPDNKVLFGLIDKVLSEQHMTDNHVCFK